MTMINSLQSLRGIFVILIFLSHYKMGSDVILPCGGDCGVAFFIMLSGFVLSAGYGERFKNRSISYGGFLSKRLRKIYPLHLFCFLWAVAAFGGFSFKTAAANVALLQSWIPSSDYYFSYNPVSWFLSDTLWFYLIFPFLTVKILARSKVAIISFLIIATVYVALLWRIPDNLANAIIYINPLARTFDFCIGMLLWQVFSSDSFVNLRSKVQNSLGFIGKTAIETTTVILLAAAILFSGQVNGHYVLSAYWWVVMALIILVFGTFNSDGGIISRILNIKMLIWFGSVSFGFFMLHVLVIRTFSANIYELPWETPETIRLVLVFILTAIIAALWHKISRRLYG